MWIRDKLCSLLCNRTLFVGLICGLASILVDTDHFIAYYILEERDLTSLRILHPFLFALCCCVLLGYGAYFGRLHFKAILERRKHEIQR